MSDSSTSNGRVIGNERGGEWLQSRPGERFWIRIPASETNGSYFVTEILSNPGDSTPVHLHENDDERQDFICEGTELPSIDARF
jgi:hypothetical protein